VRLERALSLFLLSFITSLAFRRANEDTEQSVRRRGRLGAREPTGAASGRFGRGNGEAQGRPQPLEQCPLPAHLLVQPDPECRGQVGHGHGH